MKLKCVYHESTTSLAQSPRIRAVLWLAILVLAAIRFFGPIHYTPHAKVLKGPEAVRVAYYLNKYGDWENPYGPLPTGPTAHEVPLFPAVLAGLYKIFGDGAKGAYAVEFLEASVLTAQVMMILLVVRALGADLMTGFISAILAILGLRRSYVWEQNYVGFLLVLSTLLACK